jgi:hypothetical protein
MRNLMDIIQNFEDAVSQKAFIGSSDPADEPLILCDYYTAKSRLLTFVCEMSLINDEREFNENFIKEREEK